MEILKLIAANIIKLIITAIILAVIAVVAYKIYEYVIQNVDPVKIAEEKEQQAGTDKKQQAKPPSDAQKSPKAVAVSTIAAYLFDKENPPKNKEFSEITMPVSALILVDSKFVLPVVENQQVIYKPVTIGPNIRDGRTFILDGIKTGDLVVVSPRSIPENTKVVVSANL